MFPPKPVSPPPAMPGAPTGLKPVNPAIAALKKMLPMAKPGLPAKTMPSGNHPETPPGTVAAYMSPDQGPFECDDCQFYQDPSACTKPEVIKELGPGPDGQTAQVDAKGCCNFFHKGESSTADAGDTANGQ